MSVHFAHEGICKMCGRETDAAGVCVCNLSPLPSLEEPEAGARCPRCGDVMRLVGFCAACAEASKDWPASIGVCYRSRDGRVILGIHPGEVEAAQRALTFMGGDPGPLEGFTIAYALAAALAWREGRALDERIRARWRERDAEEARAIEEHLQARKRARACTTLGEAL